MTVHVSPTRVVAPPPLVVSLPGAVAEEVRLLAEQRRDHAQSMIVALIDYVVSNGSAREMLAALDRTTPGERPGHGKRRYGGVMLTQSQAAIVYLIGENRDDDGVCRLCPDGMALLTELPIGTVQSIVNGLEKRRIIRRFGHARPGQARAWCLSGQGAAALLELAGAE